MIGGGQQNATENGRPLHETALANAQVDRERVQRGESPLFSQARQANQEVWDRAMARLDADPEAGAKLVEELKAKPRPTNAEEAALLLHRKIALDNEWQREFGRYNNAVRRGASIEEREGLWGRTQERLGQLDEVEKVIRQVGSEAGLAFQFRRQMAAEDFSLTRMLNQFRARANREPTPQEMETIARLHERIAALQQQLADRESALGGLGKRPGETNEEAAIRAGTSPEWKARERAVGELAQGQDQFHSLLNRYKEQGPVDRVTSWLERLIRFNVLSGPKTLVKLTGAAVENMIFTPIGDMVSSMWRQVPGIKQIARLAPRYGGGFSWDIEQRAKASAFTEGFRDGLEKLKYGQSTLGAQHGGEWYSKGLTGENLPGAILDTPGLVHAAMKAVPEREEYTRSFLQRQRWSARIGEDATDPKVMSRNSALAYLDAEASILMNHNIASNALNRARTYLQKQGTAGKIAALGLRMLVPVQRVPTNYIARGMEYAFGSFTGLARAGIAVGRGIERLQPQQADLIMRNLSRGSLGGAALLTGFFLGPKYVGGLYSSDKRKEGEPAPGDVGTVPSVVLHHPLFMALNIGASLRHNFEQEGIAGGLLHTAGQILGESPLVRGTRELSQVTSSNARERGNAFAGFARELTEPAFLQFIGDRVDAVQAGKGLLGPAPHRVPRTFLQGLQMGVPGLRQNVPLATR